MTYARKLHYAEVLALPRIKRLCHHKTTRHLFGVSLGISLMLMGSALALQSHRICEVLHVPHLIVDATAYFVHGFGCIPVLKHIEPLWYIFSSAE
jgi:hypothetical protein